MAATLREHRAIVRALEHADGVAAFSTPLTSFHLIHRRSGGTPAGWRLPSNQLIVKTANELGLVDPDQFSFEEVMRILERLANEPGLVGITARFSKTRVILMWGGRTP